MKGETVDLSKLEAGETYIFRTDDFRTPFGELVPGEAKLRKYVRRVCVGPQAMVAVPFVEVERPDGKRHLIAEETLCAVDRVWAAAGFVDTLLRWSMEPEVWDGNEKAVQPRVQG